MLRKSQLKCLTDSAYSDLLPLRCANGGMFGAWLVDGVGQMLETRLGCRLVVGLALCLVLVLAVGSALDLTRVLLLGLVMIDSERGAFPSALDPSNIIHPYHRVE